MEANTSKAGDVPSLLAEVEVSNLAGFDVTTPNTSPRPMPSPKPLLHPNKRSRAQVPPLDRVARCSEVVIPPFDSPFQPSGFRSVQSMSISLPASPSGFGEPIPAAAVGSSDLRRQAMAYASRDPQHPPAQDKGNNGVRFSQPDKNKMMFRSQPIPCGQPSHTVSRTSSRGGLAMNQNQDKRYDTFKTWSGKL